MDTALLVKSAVVRALRTFFQVLLAFLAANLTEVTSVEAPRVIAVAGFAAALPGVADVHTIEPRSGKTRIPSGCAHVRAAEDAWLAIALVPGQRPGREHVDRVAIFSASEQSIELVLNPLENAAAGMVAATGPGIAAAGSASRFLTSAHFLCSLCCRSPSAIRRVRRAPTLGNPADPGGSGGFGLDRLFLGLRR